MNADVRPRRKSRLELVPQFRRLIAKIPIPVLVSRRKVPFLGSGTVFIRTHTEDDAGVPFFFDQILHRRGLQGRTAYVSPQRVIHAGGQRFLILPHHQIQSPFAGNPVAILDHGRNFVARVHMQQRKRHMPEKGLAGQPQQHGGILPHRPQHGEVIEMLIGFAKDIDALVFQLT